MSSLVTVSALFLAGGLSTVTMGGVPLQGILNELFWAGLAISAFITTAFHLPNRVGPTAVGLDRAGALRRVLVMVVAGSEEGRRHGE